VAPWCRQQAACGEARCRARRWDATTHMRCAGARNPPPLPLKPARSSPRQIALSPRWPASAGRWLARSHCAGCSAKGGSEGVRLSDDVTWVLTHRAPVICDAGVSPEVQTGDRGVGGHGTRQHKRIALIQPIGGEVHLPRVRAIETRIAGNHHIPAHSLPRRLAHRGQRAVVGCQQLRQDGGGAGTHTAHTRRGVVTKSATPPPPPHPTSSPIGRQRQGGEGCVADAPLQQCLGAVIPHSIQPQDQLLQGVVARQGGAQRLAGGVVDLVV